VINSETSKASLLFVNIPNDGKNFSILNVSKEAFICYSLNGISYGFPNLGKPITIPQGNWTILNTLDEVTEGEAALIAEIDPEIDFENTATRERLPTYIDYMDDGEYYLSPKNSIKSLATSLGVQGKTIILYELK